MSESTANSMEALLLYLDRLEKANIWYRLEHVRDSVLIAAATPGSRWEIEFFPDGQVEVEQFVSTGVIASSEMLELLLTEHADNDDEGMSTKA